MDSYVKFMKKYNENPSSTKLLKEFNDYMDKYNKAMNDFDKWDSDDMNAAEEVYYLEVQNRVNKKLLEIN
ncbi:MAG: hypothetical protein IKR57_05555 [Bacilli bacterium]|nr:hypothetical protein [Bacilli bacterium]